MIAEKVTVLVGSIVLPNVRRSFLVLEPILRLPHGTPVAMLSSPDNSSHLLDLDFEALSERLVADGVSAGHTKALWQTLHRGKSPHLGNAKHLPPALQRWWIEHNRADAIIDTPSVTEDLRSGDGRTRKLLLRLDDGCEIETVIMGYPGRFTVCVSSQAGCAMGCVFCATGQMGFVRHLRPGEIVAQALVAQRLLQADGEAGLRNVVLMGMGEPLHNYDGVVRALKILGDRRGMGIAESRMTVCTVGIVPEIHRLARENLPYNLALSLHAATDEERSALVPVNQRWPIADLLDACRLYSKTTGRKVFFGWTLIAGKNDTPDHAHQVAELLRGMNAHLNLIPLNPTDGYAGRTSDEGAAEEFSSLVQQAGIPCTIRQRRGIDVAAGCGQLRSANGNWRKTRPIGERKC